MLTHSSQLLRKTKPKEIKIYLEFISTRVNRETEEAKLNQKNMQIQYLQKKATITNLKSGTNTGIRHHDAK